MFLVFLPFFINALIPPEANPKHFIPSPQWPIDDSVVIRRRIVNNGESGTSEPAPCGCEVTTEYPTTDPPTIDPPTTLPDPPASTITTIPASLSLVCDVPSPYDVTSWWLYKCDPVEAVPILYQVASGLETYFQEYAVRSGLSRNGYFSLLTINNISTSEGSGIFQCISHQSRNVKNLPDVPHFSVSDYYLIGKKEAHECFYTGDLKKSFAEKFGKAFEKGDLRQGREGVDRVLEKGLARDGVTEDQEVTTLVFDISDVIAKPSLEPEADFQPPQQPLSNEIPIQNSSYIRFDFTNGEKTQYRDSPLYSSV